MAYKFSQAVKDEQIALNARGANLKVDGLLGPLTLAARVQYPAPKRTAGSLKKQLQAEGTYKGRDYITSSDNNQEKDKKNISIFNPVKGAFKDSATYKGLSADEKALVDMAFSTFTGTEEQQRIFSDALRQATAMADPYAKAQLALFRGEYESKIAFSKGDLERQSEIIKRTRDELSQDVSSAKEFLSLQQQAEIAQETTKYDEDLLTIADQAAEKGITFATGARSRALAEERRGAQFQDVIQSGRREFNFRTKELELKASRGDIDAQKKLADMRAKSSFQLEDIGRSAEKVLGSGNVPGGTGYTATGGVLGEIEQSRRKSIIDLASLGIPK